MDYEPAKQPVNPPMEPMNQDSPHTMWYVVGAIVIIAGLALWYYSAQSPAAETLDRTVGAQTSVGEPTETSVLSKGTSVADITADFNQTPDDSAELNQAAVASEQNVQGF